jgi:hemolysin activation/secretion protein
MKNSIAHLNHKKNNNKHNNKNCLKYIALCCFPFSVLAQQPTLSPQQLQLLDQQINTSRERINVPLPKTKNFDFRIQSPEKAALPKAVDEIQFDVKGFEFEGMTYYKPEEVNDLFTALTQQKVSLDAIRKAVDALEQRYRERGFFLTRVFIPPQQVKDAVFKIKVLEGYIQNIFVEGPDEKINEQIRHLSSSLTGKRPLDLTSLERVLLLINDLPGISGSGVLKQGAELGSSDLILSTASLPQSHIISVNNSGSNITGPVSLNYNGTFTQPFGVNGALNFSVTGTGHRLEEVQSAQVRYSRTIGESGLQGSFGGLASRALPNGTSKALDLRSDAYSISPRLRYPLLRSRAHSVYIDTGLNINRNFTSLAGTALINDRSSVAELTANWSTNGWLNGNQNWSLSLFRGTSLFLPTQKGNTLASTVGFEPQFTKMTSTFVRTQKLPDAFSVQILAAGQYTPDKLAASETIVFGGPFIGRGFDPARIVGDKGIGGLIELRYDSNIELSPIIGRLQFYTSWDKAITYTKAVADFNGSSQPLVPFARRDLSSAALGVRFSVLKEHYLDFQIAHGNRKDTSPDARHNPRLLMNAVMRF